MTTASNSLWRRLEQAPAGHREFGLGVAAAIAWDANGLLPVIAQQHDSGTVLMMAWMNAEALSETLRTGQVCYWSRSRQRLWRKGEQSGHRQQLIEARLDCDGDALLLLIEQTGPACHTHRPSCFYNRLQQDQIEVLCDPVIPSGNPP